MVKRGFAREDLFTCVHEQFMTETAQMADIVLPATMFLEHDDIYRGGGHQYIMLGPKLVEPPGECRTNHEVICGLAKRVGAEHPGFAMSPRELIDQMLQRVRARHACRARGEPLDRLPAAVPAGALSRRASPGRTENSASSRTGTNVPFRSPYQVRAGRATMPALPDHWTSIEDADDEHPFRLATSPARGFLNSTFNETPTSLAQREAPERDDPSRRRAGAMALPTAMHVVLGNTRGEVRLHARLFEGVRRGVLIAESIWPNAAYPDGKRHQHA